MFKLGVSEDAQRIIKKMLELDVVKRPCAVELLSDKWIIGTADGINMARLSMKSKT